MSTCGAGGMLLGKDRADLCLRTACGRFHGQDGHIAPFAPSRCGDAAQPASGGARLPWEASCNGSWETGPRYHLRNHGGKLKKFSLQSTIERKRWIRQAPACRLKFI